VVFLVGVLVGVLVGSIDTGCLVVVVGDKEVVGEVVVGEVVGEGVGEGVVGEEVVGASFGAIVGCTPQPTLSTLVLIQYAVLGH